MVPTGLKQLIQFLSHKYVIILLLFTNLLLHKALNTFLLLIISAPDIFLHY